MTIEQEQEIPYQVTFADQSMAELNKLNTLDQMAIVESLSNLSEGDLSHPRGELGKFNRGGKTFYRLRINEYRMYFEIEERVLNCHYMLHQHSWSDFVFRFKLPYNEEKMIEQDSSFWSYLENLKK